MQILETGPNKQNGQKGTKITIKALGLVIDSWEVPKYQAVKYCLDNPNGKHGKRYAAAVAIAEKKDKWLEEMENKHPCLDESAPVDNEAWGKVESAMEEMERKNEAK